ncbi:hypothetical protein SESBI_47965 [Sesbania bispinosa]|nr:hypothetical protein SESBI_47965 [Sesbania bispinosa]
MNVEVLGPNHLRILDDVEPPDTEVIPSLSAQPSSENNVSKEVQKEPISN